MGLLVINAGVEEVVDFPDLLFAGVKRYAGIKTLHES